MQLKNPIIAPSLLAADLSCLAAEIIQVETANATWLHLDVMDGSFVPPITFGHNVVAMAKRSSKLFLDVHLMIIEPEKHFTAFKEAGTGLLTIHQECCQHLHRSLSAIRGLGMKSGVAINPGTPISTILEVLDVADLVLVMTVNPGWGGQPFLEHCLSKVANLRAEIDRRKLPTLVEVDGGITPETARRIVAAGADVLVAGSSIFGKSDRNGAFQALEKAAAR